ncbi:MAG: hypothetical protein FJ387_04560 [Verrucomicrobia bacterium]|nr:hypothetical protein [Verrucomicrobiota bacterium]
MALGDLLKSKKDRELEAKRRRRKAFREAENAVDAVKDRVGRLKKDRDAKWKEARDYLRDGQKGAAQRCLQTVRASEVMMSKLETKKWVFEQLLTKLELSKTDQEFAAALGAINTVVHIDPDKVADVLGEVEDKLGDQVDTDKIWDKLHSKEMEGVESSLADQVPSLDQMLKELEDEVAEESGGGRSGRARESAERAVKEADETAGLRARARKIIEGNAP